MSIIADVIIEGRTERISLFYDVVPMKGDQIELQGKLFVVSERRFMADGFTLKLTLSPVKEFVRETLRPV